tara:strand:+ start:39497 stop:39763 length:267 start_codon:yes stop_codon:yes gene_type:complete
MLPLGFCGWIHNAIAPRQRARHRQRTDRDRLLPGPWIDLHRQVNVGQLSVGPPKLGNKPKFVVVFDLRAVLDQAPPTEVAPWRLPKNE